MQFTSVPTSCVLGLNLAEVSLKSSGFERMCALGTTNRHAKRNRLEQFSFTLINLVATALSSRLPTLAADLP